VVPPLYGPWFVAFACLSAAVICSVCYESDWIPGIRWGYGILALAVLTGMTTVRGSRYSLLCRFILLLYALPFVECTSYLFHTADYFPQQAALWGLTANPYNQNLATVERLTFMGAIGALALAAGMLAGAAAGRRQSVPVDTGNRLQLGSTLIMAALAVMFTWVSAPVFTIFTRNYTEGPTVGGALNLNSMYLLSYVFAVAVIVDARIEKTRRDRAIKFAVVGIMLSLIVIWFQFLRGDRESVALAAAVGALFVIQGTSNRGAAKRRLAMMVAVGVAVYLSAQVIGVMRSGAKGRTFETAFIAAGPNVNLLHGTWSAVLLSPLSVVGDFERGLMRPAWGRTYVEYFLSLPPGAFAQAAGYARPIDGTRGPAWQMRYGIGGTHLVVVPFMNFLTPGVIVILFIFGVMVGVVDAHASRGRVRDLLLYGTFFVLGPFWVWYGDLSLVRGIMSFMVVWPIYRLLPKQRAAQRSWRPSFVPATAR
jgi:hypothetical protein